jgi:hypothetical protein
MTRISLRQKNLPVPIPPPRDVVSLTYQAILSQGCDMLRLSHGGIRISDVDSWKEHAPPKSRSHWVDGRSAKELATAWCGGDGVPLVPAEIAQILQSHPLTASIVIEEMEPEFLVSFDAYPGGVRNADPHGCWIQAGRLHGSD